MKRLPAAIQILGQDITIAQVDNIHQVGDRYGDWDAKSNTIRLQALGKGLPNDVVFATYFHEVAHAALDLLGHTDLSSDESFVERLGQAFYQAEKSRTYVKSRAD